MPSFTNLPAAHKEAVIALLFNLKKSKLTSKRSDPLKIVKNPRKQYKIKGYTQLKDQFGYYGIKPPWGTLNAVDLNEGKIVWKRALGEYPELKKEEFRKRALNCLRRNRYSGRTGFYRRLQ